MNARGVRANGSRRNSSPEFYTQDEGEFFDLDYDEAFARITRARDEFKAARLSPIGFVAPAWLLNHAGERAARDAGMQYTTRIDSVVDLLTGEREFDALPGLQHAFEMASHREPGVECRARAQSRNARAGTVEHSSFRFRGSENWDQILQFIERFARTRNATTYRDWIGRQRTNRKAT